ncbi:MAG: ATP-binding protein [Aromatoleum sp.]|jgi:signal transduction histidine kinase|uniref:sensor histidine kinase n=1 Tax=Aromatoleum sp. TaxID=2307007 RepID=UPI002893A971|nr:ATP-binding protein [Aromatoleum sp.]MDT3670056.1 ATP-binding protein [Aromatoleum sp.]
MNSRTLAGQDGNAAAEPQASAATRSPRPLSLKTKGILAFVAMVIYVVLIGTATEMQRQNLLEGVGKLEQAHRVEAQLLEINTSMARTLLAVNLTFSADDLAAASIRAMIEVEATLSLLEAIQGAHPEITRFSNSLHADVRDIAQAPSIEVLGRMRATLNGLIIELDRLTQEAHAVRLSLLDAYRQNYDRITLSGLAMLVVGLILLGAVIAIFFSRLTWDIRKLEAHARGIVMGDRDNPMQVTRNDELGSLMRAVNRMQEDLRQHERNIERARFERFHREKMVAVGSLAAQLAHEINNPIAAITGVASAMNQVQQADHCPNRGHTCKPGLILEQARRISLITRQIADFTRPQTQRPELLNLNELVRNTCAFVSYDRRFRRIALTTELDDEMPAIRAIADHLTQVLMNLLINAADALDEMPSEHQAEIRVATRVDEREATIEISDNGGGIAPEMLERVFEEYFTTKPAGKGTGLGLALSRELIQDAGGSLVLESTPGLGTTVRLTLPLLAAEQAT